MLSPEYDSFGNYVPPPETVDDHIAWFRTNCQSWEDGGYYFQDVSAGRVFTDFPWDLCSVTFCESNRYTVAWHGPTLLEACRKAYKHITHEQIEGP